MKFIILYFLIPSLILSLPQVFLNIKKDFQSTLPSINFFPKYKNYVIDSSNVQITIRESIEKYRAIYKRDPPRNYDRWVFYCLKNLVIIDPSYYQQINTDFLPFRDPLRPERKTITKKLLEEWKKVSMVKSFTQNHESLPENANGIRRSFNEVVKLGLNILPKKFEILFKSSSDKFFIKL